MNINISCIESHVQEEQAAWNDCHQKAQSWLRTMYISLCLLVLLAVSVLIIRLTLTSCQILETFLVACMFPALGATVLSIWRYQVWYDHASRHSLLLPYLNAALRDAQNDKAQ